MERRHVIISVVAAGTGVFVISKAIRDVKHYRARKRREKLIATSTESTEINEYGVARPSPPRSRASTKHGESLEMDGGNSTASSGKFSTIMAKHRLKIKEIASLRSEGDLGHHLDGATESERLAFKLKECIQSGLMAMEASREDQGPQPQINPSVATPLHKLATAMYGEIDSARRNVTNRVEDLTLKVLRTWSGAKPRTSWERMDGNRGPHQKYKLNTRNNFEALFTAMNSGEYKRLREHWGVDEDFWEALCRLPLSGGVTQKSGKSGSIFWYSQDHRYILKTIDAGELRALSDLLPHYFKHVSESNPDSLICRFAGAFKLEVDDDTITFVVMNNTFAASKPPDVCYDLKGTTEDRWVRPVGGAVLKDLNFADKLIGLKDNETAKRMVNAIRKDAEFLALHDLMDYSLLLGVRYLDTDETLEEADDSSRPALALLEGFEPHKASPLVRNAGAKPVVYYLGVIDLLQEYNLKKKAAHLIKASSIGWFREIDTEPPDKYCRRFSNYFKEKVSTFVETDEKLSSLIQRAIDAASKPGAKKFTYGGKDDGGKDGIREALEFTASKGGRLTFYHSMNSSIFRRVSTEEVEAFLDVERWTFTFRNVTAEDTDSSRVSISCYSIREVLVSLLKDRRHSRFCHYCDNPVKIEAPSLAVRRFTIKSSGYPDLRFAAPSKKQKQLWVTALESLCNLLAVEEKSKQLSRCRLDGYEREYTFAQEMAKNRWWQRLDLHFQYMDEDLSGGLDIGEVRRGWIHMNINPDGDKNLKKMFADCVGKENGSVDRAGFMHMLETLDKGREDTIGRFFRKVSTDGHVMTAEDMQRFFSEVQKQDLDLDELQYLIKLLASLSEAGRAPLAVEEGILPAGFSHMMCSGVNGILHPSHSRVVDQDMTHPLHEYWLASSHNTYLEGNQLSSQSSVLQYVHVLNCGCRCIEIDSWDGPDGEPVVRHGYTATTTIYFEDVISAIADNSFRVSPYPVVISIEQNCVQERQLLRQGRIMKNILGDRLLKPVVGEDKEIDWTQTDIPTKYDEKQERHLFPSPEEAKGKFIVKSKVCECSRCRHSLMEYNTCIAMPTMKYHKDSGECAEYIQTGEVTSGRTGWHCASFSEDKAEAWIKKEHAEVQSSWRLIEWHKAHFSRVYPMATRVSSSNFDPIIMWSAGWQMVALNYQTLDKSMILNTGLFENSNGNCGYVLKSQRTRGLPMHKPGDKLLVGLTLRIVSGHRIPKPKSVQTHRLKSHSVSGKQQAISSPYVVVTATTTKGNERHRTVTVRNNGFDPYFDSTHEFSFDKAADPELAFLMFEVFDEDENEQMAHACFPLRYVRPGLRWVPLSSTERGADVRHAGLLVEVGLSTESI